MTSAKPPTHRAKAKRRPVKATGGFNEIAPPSIDIDDLFTAEQLKAAARSLGIRKEGDFEIFYARLTGAASAYFWARERAIHGPTRPQIKSGLLGVQRAASTLADELRTLDYTGARWLSNALIGTPSIFELPGADLPLNNGQRLAVRTGLSDLRADLEYLAGCARYLVNHMKMPTRGRKLDPALDALFSHLEELYAKFIEDDPKRSFTYSRTDKLYGGPFFLFVEMCVRRIDPALKLSNNALGEKLRRHMGWR